MYYIVSLRHTRKSDKCITLWGPNDKGYCFCKETSGLYSSYKEGYHNSHDNKPIAKELADPLFEKVDYFGGEKYVILNNAKNRKALGIKYDKNGSCVLVKGGEGK